MVRFKGGEYTRKVRTILSSDKLPDLLCLDYLGDHVRRPERHLDPDKVLAWCRQANPERVVLLAGLMGRSKDPAYKSLLVRWARGRRGARANAALEAIGHYADSELVDLLVSRLSSNWSRRSARRALVNYGNAVSDHLARLLRQPDLDLEIKREIPPVLAKIDTAASRAGLVAALYSNDVNVSYRALKGLNKIRNRSDLSYDQTAFLPVLQMWAKQYFELLNVDQALDGRAEGRGIRLLRAAISERMEWTIEKIFRALGLFFPAGEAYYSYLGYTSNRLELQANAVELIESRLPGELKKTLLSIFSGEPSRRVVREGRRLFGLPSDPAEILADALYERDAWLKCCLLAAIAELQPSRFRRVVRQALDDIHPGVRETAQWVLSKWDTSQPA